MRDTSLSRRRFLTLTGGAALATAGGGLLAACGGDSADSGGQPVASTVKLPAYQPSTLVKPDLAGTAEGIMPAYYDFPRDAVTAVSGKPAEGLGEVSILTNILAAVPPALGGNAFWQELNKRAGADLKITMTPQGDYLNKLSTVVAGGDLPDAMLISSTLANRGDVLTRLCADLTELLSGDAIKKYPNLANFPTDSWLNTVYSGGIFAIPIPRAIVGTVMFARQDIIRQRGLPAAPASYAEFHELARGLTDARANRWAFGNIKQIIVYIGNMLDVPNVWREQGGKFTHEIETPERKRAVGLAAEMFKEGLFHPDSPGNKLQYRDLFGAGTISLVPDGYAAWDILANTYPEVEIGAIPEPGFDGGQGAHRAGTTSFGLTAFKKADKARVEGLLRLCDWLATPLGTSEYLFRKYGVEGVHYTWVGGKPKRTPAGETQVKLPLEYITDAPHVLGPGPRERVDAQRAYQEKAVPKVVRNPAEGLYSPTAVSKASALAKIVDAAELDIVAGRKPLDSWDDAVKQWRQAGGDKARAELEAALSQKPS